MWGYAAEIEKSCPMRFSHHALATRTQPLTSTCAGSTRRLEDRKLRCPRPTRPSEQFHPLVSVQCRAIRCSVLLPWSATLARGSLVARFSDRVALLLVLPALATTSGACAPTVATGAGAVQGVFCKVSDFARAALAAAAEPSVSWVAGGVEAFFPSDNSAPGVLGEVPLVRSASRSPRFADSSSRNSNSRPCWNSCEGLSINRVVTRSILAWIVIAYLSEPMERVMICSTVWIGAGAGLGKRSSFATLGIVGQRVYICKCWPQWLGCFYGAETLE